MIERIMEVFKKNERFLIISDSDGDGLTGAAIVRILLKKLGKHVDTNPIKHGELLPENLKKCFEEKYDTCILIDTPFDDDILVDVAKKNNKKMFIYIDHHKRFIPKDLPNNIVYFDIRALEFSPVVSCASISYKIGKRIFGNSFKKYSLLAIIGSFLDYMLDDDVIKDFEEEYPEFMYNGKPTYNFFLLIDLVTSFYKNDWKFFIENVAEKLVENPLEVFRDKKIIKKMIENKKRTYEEIYHTCRNTEIKSNVVVAKSKHTSSLPASFLKSFFKDKVILVYSPKDLGILDKLLRRDDVLKISLRSRVIDVGTAIEEFSRIHGIKGGGHPEAAGGLIYKKDLEKLIKFLNENFNNFKIKSI